MDLRYVRYQSPTPNHRGHRTGIFGLANGLARAGALAAAEMRFWRANNAWYEANLTYPDAHVYDRAVNPFAASWFRTSAVEFLMPIPGYLAILRSHGVDCVEVRSNDPGSVLYEDEHQIVVVPRAADQAEQHQPEDARTDRAGG
jgi:hypothetical protein